MWQPKSPTLRKVDGIWTAETSSTISYPSEGNDIHFQLEEGSYWFKHRNQCLCDLFSRFPPAGIVYDIGGGNGFVALGLQHLGHEVAVVEPGSGAVNALRRGVKNVIQSRLEDAAFDEGSLPAIGAFDVVEHIGDDGGFLRQMRTMLKPGGAFTARCPP